MKTSRLSLVKTIPVVLPLVFYSAFLLTGCSLLIPKKVEIGQKKVEAIAEKSGKQVELEKVAAAFVAEKVDEAKVAAVAEQSSPAVMAPLSDADKVAPALSTSLGPPAARWDPENPAQELADKLNARINRLERTIEDQRKEMRELVGKKIEGTGWFQMNYISFVLLAAVLCFVGYSAIRIALRVYGAMNPLVGLADSVVTRASHSVVSAGFKATIKGGELFKDALQEVQKRGEALTTDKVIELFTTSQKIAQPPEVQSLIKDLTRRPSQ